MDFKKHNDKHCTILNKKDCKYETKKHFFTLFIMSGQ